MRSSKWGPRCAPGVWIAIVREGRRIANGGRSVGEFLRGIRGAAAGPASVVKQHHPLGDLKSRTCPLRSLRVGRPYSTGSQHVDTRRFTTVGRESVFDIVSCGGAQVIGDKHGHVWRSGEPSDGNRAGRLKTMAGDLWSHALVFLFFSSAALTGMVAAMWAGRRRRRRQEQQPAPLRQSAPVSVDERSQAPETAPHDRMDRHAR